MTTALATAATLEARPLNLNAYDRSPSLSHVEQAALAGVCSHRFQTVRAAEQRALWRLLAPILDVLRIVGIPDPTGARSVMLREMHRRQTAFWAWNEPVWSRSWAPAVETSKRALRASPACESTCSSSPTSSADFDDYTDG